MTSTKSDWVCGACRKHDHKNCEGTEEDPEKIVNFCECGLCILRFKRNIRKALSQGGK